MKAVLGASLFFILSGPPTAVTLTAERVDRVEREIAGNGRTLFTTFATVHQINGAAVSTRTFWRSAQRGLTVQAKLYPRAGQYWAARINLRLP